MGAQRFTPLFEEIGVGQLFVGSSGQGTEALRACPVAKLNAPARSDRMDAAHIGLYDGTTIFQWWGRKGDGFFHPVGKMLRLTPAGHAALAKAEADGAEHMKPVIARLRAALAKASAPLTGEG